MDDSQHRPVSLMDGIALVTGGSGGIGSSVCRRLSGAGISVAINYLRNREKAEALLKSLRGSGGDAEVFQANVGKADEVARLTEMVIDRFGRIDFLVHCASLGTFSPTVSTRASHWDLTFAVHTTAFWECARSFSEIMPSGGSMVAVSSLGARRFTPEYGAVGVAKGALETLVKYLAVELGTAGIRVNAICGGPVDGERLRTSPRFSEIEEEAKRRPSRRLGTAEELADVALFLVSPQARWVQGQVIVVDGGFTLW
jgi:enoyl-[acyl-carrier protein] reductase III